MNSIYYFVGPFKTASGWGVAARRWARALLTQTDQVQLIDFYMGGGKTQLDDDLVPYEAKIPYLPSNNNILIQNVLAPYMYYHGGYKNVGLSPLDRKYSNNWRYFSNINILDRFITTNAATYNDAKILGEPIDFSVQNGTNNKALFGCPDDYCLFYTIAEDNERKNLSQLIEAFCLYQTLSKNSSSKLFIKTNRPQKSKIDAIIAKYGFSQSVSQNIVVDHTRWPESKIRDLHASGDVFISTSHGEGWCLPSFDALACGSRLVVPKHFPASHYIDQHIQEHEECAGQKDSPFPGFHTRWDMWFNYSNVDIIDEIAMAHTDWSRGSNRVPNLSTLTYDFIGRALVGKLK